MQDIRPAWVTKQGPALAFNRNCCVAQAGLNLLCSPNWPQVCFEIFLDSLSIGTTGTYSVIPQFSNKTNVAMVSPDGWIWHVMCLRACLAHRCPGEDEPNKRCDGEPGWPDLECDVSKGLPCPPLPRRG